jgi:cytochrome c biogenesis protein CcdA
MASLNEAQQRIASALLLLRFGVFIVMSPCVWPLVPVVKSSAATSGRSGPWFLAPRG